MVGKLIKKTLKSRNQTLVLLTLTGFIFALYIFALVGSTSLESFLHANTIFYVLAQFALSLISAFLTALALLYFVLIFRLQKQGGENVVQAVVAFGISFFTTGCYVCGTMLLPVIGVSTGFGALPLAGLEIKLLVVLFLWYSVRELAKIYLGLCPVKKYRTFVLGSGKNEWQFSTQIFDKVKPFFISGMFIILIVILPAIIPESISAGINYKPTEGRYLCNK